VGVGDDWKQGRGERRSISGVASRFRLRGGFALSVSHAAA
jgi:hypothetical protein